MERSIRLQVGGSRPRARARRRPKSNSISAYPRSSGSPPVITGCRTTGCLRLQSESSSGVQHSHKPRVSSRQRAASHPQPNRNLTGPFAETTGRLRLRLRASKSATFDGGCRRVTDKGTAPKQICERPCTPRDPPGLPESSRRSQLAKTSGYDANESIAPRRGARRHWTCVMAFKSLECGSLAPAPGVQEHFVRHPGVSHSLNPWQLSANPAGSGLENGEITIAIRTKREDQRGSLLIFPFSHSGLATLSRRERVRWRRTRWSRLDP